MAYGSASLEESLQPLRINHTNSAHTTISSRRLKLLFICLFSVLLFCSFKAPETQQSRIYGSESDNKRNNRYRKAKNKESRGHVMHNPATILSHLTSNKTTESVVFLNEMIDHLWPYIDVAAGRLVKSIVEPMFSEMLPGPFKNTKFLEIDLGTDPMFLDRIDFIAQTNDSLRLHMDVSWDAATSIKLKSPIVGTYGCKRIQMEGRMSILLKPLVPSLPVISAIQAGFINPPDLEMNFSGIADLADVSFLRGHIYKIINSVMASLIVLPNRLLVPVIGGNDFFRTYTLPIGVLKLSLLNGTGFKTTGGIRRDTPDVYVIVGMGAEKPEQSEVKNNDNKPEWNEDFEFIYSDSEQNIELEAFDKDLDKDDYQGSAVIPAYQVLGAPGGILEVPLLKDGVSTGASLTLQGKVLPFSTEKSYFQGANDDGNDEKFTGLLSLIVAGARNITEEENFAPFAKINVGKSQFITPVVIEAPGIDPRNPDFNSLFRIPLSKEILDENPRITFELFKNDRKSIGKKSIRLNDVIKLPSMEYSENIHMKDGSVMMVGTIVKSLQR